MKSKRFELRVVINMPAHKAPQNRLEERGYSHDSKNKAVRKVLGFYPTYDKAIQEIRKRNYGIMKYELIDHKNQLIVKVRWDIVGEHRILEDKN